MCGIFGIVSNNSINLNDLKVLANHSRQSALPHKMYPALNRV